MKIAYISIVRDPWGGSEELWASSAEEALRNGHTVIISAFKRPDLSQNFIKLKNAGAKLLLRRGYIAPETGMYRRIATKAFNFILNKIFNPFVDITRLRPDVIVYTGACYSIADDAQLLKLLKSSTAKFFINNQVNIEYSRPINNAEAEIIKNAYDRADKVLFVSKRNIQTAERHLIYKIENQLIVRNPVNIQDVSLITFPNVTGVIRFAMVANLLVNHKGHDILFEVLNQPEWRQRNYQLNIYGSGNDELYIKNLVDWFNLRDKIIFHGRTNDIRKVWEENHVLLMPSLNEGIPLAVVEAMLCGRVVIATDTGGHSEWINDSENGYIAEGANILSFGRALERAWQEKESWKEKGEKAHQTALSMYDPFAGKTFLNLIVNHGRRS